MSKDYMATIKSASTIPIVDGLHLEDRLDTDCLLSYSKERSSPVLGKRPDNQPKSPRAPQPATREAYLILNRKEERRRARQASHIHRPHTVQAEARPSLALSASAWELAEGALAGGGRGGVHLDDAN